MVILPQLAEPRLQKHWNRNNPSRNQFMYDSPVEKIRLPEIIRLWSEFSRPLTDRGRTRYFSLALSSIHSTNFFRSLPGSAGWWSKWGRGWAWGFRRRCPPLWCWPAWSPCSGGSGAPSPRSGWRGSACDRARGAVKDKMIICVYVHRYCF